MKNSRRKSKACSIVTTTAGSRRAAERLADGIVDARLAACVQVLAIRSVYRWKGRVEKAGEFMLIAKTKTGLVKALEAHIKAKHTYEVPEIVAVAITDGSKAYLDWIGAETGDGDAR